MSESVYMSGGVCSQPLVVDPAPLGELTAQSLSFEKQGMPVSGRSPLLIWSVNTPKGRYVARSPISVKVILEGLTFYAVNEHLDLHGVGATSQQALDDLMDHIAHTIVHYEGKPVSNVAGGALENKRKFERAFYRQ